MKEKERSAVVKHIRYRAQAGKISKSVRIRGHKKSEEILVRWLKEGNMRNTHVPAHPPSSESTSTFVCSLLTLITALPDCISIHTYSTSRSRNRLLSYDSMGIQPTVDPETPSDVLQRILQYSQASQSNIGTREARFFLNDIQTILTSSDSPCSTPSTLSTEEDIVQIRNIMNLTQRIDIDINRKGISLPP